MGTPWDRASEGYVAEWLPRFSPYHLDLVEELALTPGNSVLVPCCGTGPEVLVAARELGCRSGKPIEGVLRATDPHVDLVGVCQKRIAAAGFDGIDVAAANPSDVSGGPWDAIICAFGLWQLDHRVDVLKAWGSALSSAGKVGILTWGPPEQGDPFELMLECLRQVEPTAKIVAPRIHAERDAIGTMFESAGLVLVRHTVVRHTLSFVSAEAFVSALKEARHWHEAWADLGEATMQRAAAGFYGKVGGATAPLSWDAPATVAIAARPGAEIALKTRPSLRVPSAG